jgi:hypothetical protein
MAMDFYAISVGPLIDQLRPEVLPDIGDGVATQAWYADDAQAAAKMRAARRWWDKLVEVGPRYGYYPKAVKSFCVLKPGLRAEAERIFAGTGVQLTDEGPDLEHKNGQRQLGAAIGTKAFIEKYIRKKVNKWTTDIETLAHVALTQRAARCLRRLRQRRTPSPNVSAAGYARHRQVLRAAPRRRAHHARPGAAGSPTQRSAHAADAAACTVKAASRWTMARRMHRASTPTPGSAPSS